MARDLLIRGAHVLPTATAEEPFPADILVLDGVIEAIAPHLPVSDPGWEVLDASDCFAIPGLINAHLHSPGNLLRGTLDGLPLEVFMLYEVPPLAEEGEEYESPELVRLRTLIGAAEMLRLGITSVMDDAFFVPLVTDAAVDAIAGAYAEIGMRATLALDQPIVVEYEKYPFLAELLPEELRREMDRAPRETAEGMLAHYARLIARWHGAADGLIGAAVSCSAPQRATPDYLSALSALARRHDLPFFCHILETKLQRVLGEERFKTSLVRYAADIGVLDERMQVIHAIWVDPDDIALIARAGAVVAHNPVCNMRLGSGVMPFRALKDAGVQICLGTDEAVSDDSHNLWGAMKAAATVHALTDRDYSRWPKAAEILDCVWEGGNRAMRRPRPIGRIEVGAAADIALLCRDAPPFLPFHDLRRQLVLCESGASVRHTVVDGRVVMRDRQLMTIDERRLVAEIRSLETKVRAAAANLRRSAAALEPYYRAMVMRAAERDVGFTRWIEQ